MSAMSTRDEVAVVGSSEDGSPEVEISAGQSMLSAVSGSILTSLIGIQSPCNRGDEKLIARAVTPLDVVRVRLQSQPVSPSFSAARTSSFLPSTSFTNAPNLGVTACCREVFWVSNNAQYCVAASSGEPTFNAITSPAHVSSPSVANCAVEETQRKTFTSTFDGLQKIARNEGPRSLWRGLSPTLLMAIPGNVIYFAGYDTLRYSKRSPIKDMVPDAYAPLLAGSVARVTAAAAISPIEMFRTRMQATSGGATGVFRDTLLGVKDMVQAQGYATLWRGLTLTMWRDVPFSGLYWWGYEAVRNKLADVREMGRGRSTDLSEDRTRIRGQSRNRSNHTVTFVDSFMAGATSGAVASLVTTPFDVGKTRQQVYIHANDFSSDSASASKPGIQRSRGSASAAPRELMPEERTMPRFLYHIFKTEGVAGLFKGWAARCLKVAPACAIMISSYEVGKKMARDVNEQKME
ncbi:hypothetical protein MMC10_007573 [Thelotrema lepadinum]|nr:hypothetical protein [Thelotrema lepadinum]